MKVGMRASQSRDGSISDSGEADSAEHYAPEEAAACEGNVRDQLEYLADMILEMRQIAARAGLGTLSGILDLAHSEARLQADRNR